VASLLENLIDVLGHENTEYEALQELADKKTTFIIKGDIKNLDKITEEEQVIVGRINKLEKTRRDVLVSIADVVNRDVETLKLKNLIQMLEKRPDQQAQLVEVQEKLSVTIQRMKEANVKNQMLLEDALEMVGFNLNMLRALKSAPQTADYTKNAYNTGNVLGIIHGGFDAKQ